MCNEDDLILDALFDFKPMERLEYLNDVKWLEVRVTARASPC